MVADSCPNPQSVGREFVRQYYTMLNQSPHYLHRFYSSESYFVHGGLEPYSRDMTPSIGQKEIHKRVQELNFRDCHAKILQVDSQNTLGNGVVVHVTGELSNCGQPMRRFAQTFVLAAQSPKKYYVHNDIFRYQDVIMNEDDTNEEADSGQSDGEENGEVEQAPVIQQPQHQVNYYNTPIQGQALNGVAMNVIPTSVPVQQQLPPEQIPIQVQQHVPTVTAPVQNLAPTVLPPSNNVSRAQLTYNQNNQIPAEQPKMQHQEESTNHHVETKEIQEPTKKETPITEVTSPGDQPKPLYAQLFKSSGRSVETTHTEPSQSVTVPSQNYSSPSLPKATSPVRNNDYSNNSFGNNQYEQRNSVNRNVRNNNYNRGGMSGRNNVNERPNRNTFNNRGDNGYNSSSGNDTRINRGNQPGSYNGMFQSDDQQLFIGKIPPEVQESDLRNLFEKFGNLLDVRIMKGGSKTGDPSMNGNFGFVIFESIETAHKVLKSRPIMFPDENGIKLNVEEKKNKSRSSLVNPDGGGGLGRGGMRSGNNRGGFNRNQNDGPRNNFRRQN